MRVEKTDMLSQPEVDAMLAKDQKPEVPKSEPTARPAEFQEETPARGMASSEEKKVQPYDFWSPNRFYKDQMRALELLHQDLAELLSASLPSFLRTNSKPRVVQIEQGRFHDFMKDLNENTIFHLITLSPLPSQIILTISPEVCADILELQLGGPAGMVRKPRAFTEIDQALLRSLVEFMLGDIKASWSRVASVEPKLEDSTTNHHWVQMTVGNERMTMVVFDLSVLEVSGRMNLYIPFSLLKPIENLLDPHLWVSGYKDRSIDKDAQEQAFLALSQVSLPLRILLGNARLSLEDLARLQPGDILCLDTKLNQDVQVNIAGKHCFMARPGSVGTRLAVQINSLVSPADERKTTPTETRGK
jgi:flagellar motor switch protein FliM